MAITQPAKIEAVMALARLSRFSGATRATEPRGGSASASELRASRHEQVHRKHSRCDGICRALARVARTDLGSGACVSAPAQGLGLGCQGCLGGRISADSRFIIPRGPVPARGFEGGAACYRMGAQNKILPYSTNFVGPDLKWAPRCKKEFRFFAGPGLAQSNGCTARSF